MKKLGLALLCALVLSACATETMNKKPTAAQRAREVAQIKTQLAVEYLKNQNYRQAVEAIDEAIKNNSSSLDAWLIRAQIWQYLKEPAKAEESFQRALSLASDSDQQ